ncbi:MAG: 30S ribosomal protein S18 [Patescibacteria group bacterium]|nr:30S ribosomal protein S18 [Patescibacteria group bacterium]
MAEKKVTRKVISKGKVTAKEAVKEPVEVTQQAEEMQKEKPKKACLFCQGKNCPSYTDVATLRRYMSDRAKIVARAKSNLCSKHQRRVAKQIKYARHLALLPFTPKV